MDSRGNNRYLGEGLSVPFVTSWIQWFPVHWWGTISSIIVIICYAATAKERRRQENPGDSPIPITSVSVEGNKSLLLLSTVQLRGSVLSAGRYLAGPSNLSGSVMSYLGLISGVLPEKDPWPPGLQRPRIDLSLVLLLSASPALSPWALLAPSRSHPGRSAPAPNVTPHQAEFGGSSQTFMPPHSASTWRRPEAYGSLSVCLSGGDVVFCPDQTSCCNVNVQQIQTALLPWHTVTRPVRACLKLKG